MSFYQSPFLIDASFNVLYLDQLFGFFVALNILSNNKNMGKVLVIGAGGVSTVVVHKMALYPRYLLKLC